MRSRRYNIVLVAVTAALATVLPGELALGERSQSGNVIASLKSDIRPHFLPRSRSVPVTLSLSSDFSTADGTRVPQLRTISIAVGWGGALRPPGLPVCRSTDIRVATRGQAMSRCGRALIGRGRLNAEIAMPGQRSFAFKGSMLAFNGRLPDGRVAIVSYVHSKAPPLSFVMPFVIREGSGLMGTTMTAKLPKTAGGWAHVTHFDLTLGRRYRHEGRTRSVLMARCGLPRGFTALVFPVAQATYTFAGGRSITATAVRACSVRS